MVSRFATAVGVLGAWLRAANALAQSGEFTAPRTSFGHPDLSGTWTNNNATPLQRPAQWANKELLTEAELEAVQSAAGQLEEDGPPRDFERRTSLIIDPPNGRIYQPDSPVAQFFCGGGQAIGTSHA